MEFDEHIEVVAPIKYDDEAFESNICEENISINATSQRSKKKKKRRRIVIPRFVTKAEKVALAKLIEKEPLLWDLKNELHSNMHAVAAAWQRISNKMTNRSVSDCKGIWKSLRDALRYRKKKKGKMGDSGSEQDIEAELELEWEFQDCMAFIAPMFPNYTRKTAFESNISEENVSINTTSQRSASPKSKNKNKRRSVLVPRLVTKSEKVSLAKLVEKEPLLWDLKDELHSNIHAVTAAWERISNQMPNRTVSDCKGIWKSLRDALRYQKKKKDKMGDSGGEQDIELESEWEFQDCMAFIAPTSSKYPHNTTTMELESFDSQSIGSPSSASVASVVTDDSLSESNYPYADVVKKKEDPLSESVYSMSNTITDFVTQSADEQLNHHQPVLKFEYIWRNLDKMFEKMTEKDVDLLNMTYIQLAYDTLYK